MNGLGFHFKGIKFLITLMVLINAAFCKIREINWNIGDCTDVEWL